MVSITTHQQKLHQTARRDAQSATPSTEEPTQIKNQQRAPSSINSTGSGFVPKSTSSGAWPTPATILQIWAAAHSFNDQHPIKKSRFHSNGGSRIPFMEVANSKPKSPGSSPFQGTPGLTKLAPSRCRRPRIQQPGG
ncbi:hypothetical protein ACLOJK_019580, partial [Asimina triloba]